MGSDNITAFARSKYRLSNITHISFSSQELEAFTEVHVGGPVFDTSPEIRRKVTAILKEGILNQTTFLKHLGVQSGPYNKFMKMKPVATEFDATFNEICGR